ncbi:MAG: hypothetical protein SNJ64_01050 [Endomicrobiia bacterium]
MFKKRIFVKKYIFFILNLVFLILVFVSDNFSNNFPWQQKLIVKDFAGNYKGWVEIFITTCSPNQICDSGIDLYSKLMYSQNVNFQESSDNMTNNPLVTYCTTIISDTDLPFWFFSGKSKTYECEFYDKNFSPIESNFLLYGKEENFKITTKKIFDNFNILWKSSKAIVKEKTLPANKNILTAGNLRNIIMSLDLTIKDNKTFFLLDKFKLETKRLIISTTGKTHTINNIDTYRINIDIGILGKFSFYIDKNYNVIYGEGMGIKVYPEK